MKLIFTTIVFFCSYNSIFCQNGIINTIGETSKGQFSSYITIYQNLSNRRSTKPYLELYPDLDKEKWKYNTPENSLKVFISAPYPKDFDYLYADENRNHIEVNYKPEQERRANMNPKLNIAVLYHKLLIVYQGDSLCFIKFRHFKDGQFDTNQKGQTRILKKVKDEWKFISTPPYDSELYSIRYIIDQVNSKTLDEIFGYTNDEFIKLHLKIGCSVSKISLDPECIYQKLRYWRRKGYKTDEDIAAFVEKAFITMESLATKK